MKKIILICLLVIITTISFAQVSSVVATSWCFKTPITEWSQFESFKNPVPIIITDDYVSVYTKETQFYAITSTTTENTFNEDYILSFYCNDDEGIRCQLRIVVRKDNQLQLYIDYADLNICYNISDDN